MTIYKKNQYQYCKSYLYPLKPEVSGAATVEIEINGGKGQMNCQVDHLVVAPSHSRRLSRELSVMIQKETSGNLIGIGKIRIDHGGCGSLKWGFNVCLDEGWEELNQLNYKLIVLANLAKGKTLENLAIMEGMVSLGSELRDQRIVGFKKEGNDKITNPKPDEVNSLFQKVEPFQPSIPNCVWWRINVLPDLSEGYTGFCPKSKSYKVGY